jgi:ATP-dependent helicase HrpB
LIFRGFPDRLARQSEEKPGRYVLVGGRGAALSDRSAVHNEPLVVAVRLDAGKRGPRSEASIQWASAVEAPWVEETGRVSTETETFFDEARGKVAAARITRYEDLELSRSVAAPDPEEGAQLLAARALSDPLGALKPDERALTLLRRIGFLTKALGPERFPAWGEEQWRTLVERVAYGKTSFEDLRRADLVPAMLNQLPHAARKLLDSEAPERLTVPSGSNIRLHYMEDGPPVLAVKIQEMFGLAQAPRVAEGRVPVVVHLLGPNGRPLQVTADLASFWKTGYPEVRKEMRGRYPRHNWPEDPTRAAPSRRTLKKPPR